MRIATHLDTHHLPTHCGHAVSTLLLLLSWAFLTLAPSMAVAALIATGDGTGNTTPPNAAEDPGFNHVGTVSAFSGVYVGNGWVLTANHVGIGPITLMGVTYEPVPDSKTPFTNAAGNVADLIAFKLRTRPPLPSLILAATPPATNTLLTIIGNGRSRGAAQLWMGVEGWAWGGAGELRWGTNRISATGQFSLNTEAFWVTFDDIPSSGANPHEADIVNGDSGGAAFSGDASSAELVGILFAHAAFDGQPASTSLFGNVGVIVDLYQYRSQILSVINQPECNNNLDDDGDGFTDFPADTGCDFSSESDERTPLYECDNGIDDDNDSMIDFPNDPGCLHPSNQVEAPEPSGLLLLGSGLIALCGLARTRRRRA